MHIVMVASENAALKGGKAGGIGDVIRDVPLALARQGHQVSVITPGYQQLARINDSKRVGSISTVFCSQPLTLELYRLQATGHEHDLVNHYVLDHPQFAACGAGSIYCHDESAPFATDAHKFALFCTAVCEWLSADELHAPDVIHLHDWHASMVAVLRKFHPRYQSLRSIRTVFSIHNLSLQGIRPLRGDHSSLAHWHPELMTRELWRKNSELQHMVDPRYQDCINLMRCGLLLSDSVHTVSPGYCDEIQQPSNPQKGFVGGEGLELDLRYLATQRRLSGILNGCEYPLNSQAETPLSLQDGTQRKQVYQRIIATLMQWSEHKEWIPASLLIASQRVVQWQQLRKAPALSMVSIGRLTDQKVSLLRTELTGSESDSATALDHILRNLGDGIYILVGTGDNAYEQFFTSMMRKHKNFLYLQGFSEELADMLYTVADLFLMPSSYEPCGISQMLAMRAGTPCIVHATGGLKNTVINGVNGFLFEGDSVATQSANMLICVQQACDMASSGADRWQQIKANAGAARFLWDDSVRQYISRLYTAG